MARISARARDALAQATDGNDILSAFAIMHAVWRHICGLSAADIVTELNRWRPHQAWPEAVVRSISDFRRAGLVGPIADNIGVAWASYLLLASQAAREQGLRCPDDDIGVTDDLDRFYLAGQHRRVLTPLPDPAPFARRLSDLVGVDEIPPFEESLDRNSFVFRLEAEHLSPYRRILLGVNLFAPMMAAAETEALVQLRQELMAELESCLTPLEQVGLLPDPIRLQQLDAVTAASARLVMIPHMAPGFWADTYPGQDTPNVPGWVVDQVLTGGARSQKYTTGCLHSWLAVSEGPWDRSRLGRTLHEVTSVGYSIGDNELTLSLLLPEHTGDRDPLVLDFTYQLSNASALHALLTLVATMIVRLEVFAIEAGALRFLGATAIPLPAELQERISEAAFPIFESQFDLDASRLIIACAREAASSVEEQAAARFHGSERARHELMWELSPLAPEDGLSAEERATLRDARDAYLAAESSRARNLLVGLPDDTQQVDSTRSALERALSTRRSQPRSTGALARLPPGAAFLHVDVRDYAVDCCLAGNTHGTEWYRWIECVPVSSFPDTLDRFLALRHTSPRSSGYSVHDRAHALDTITATLTETLEGLPEVLAEYSVEHIIVSTGGNLDGLPIHLLPLDPATRISYAPSLRFLSHIPDRPVKQSTARTEVLAYAGEGPDASPAIERECRVVASLHHPPGTERTAATPDDFINACGADIIHVSSHGVAGVGVGARGLLLSPGGRAGFLPATEILRKCSLTGTRLVYLAACSSAVADHKETLIQSFGGVDFACISAGARATVATLWDVNDVASAIFGSVFHATLVTGVEITEAYAAAQTALATDLALMPPQLLTVLDESWPDWSTNWGRVPLRTHPVHWGAFRLSGRVWR